MAKMHGKWQKYLENGKSTWKMARVSRPNVGLKQRLVSNLKCRTFSDVQMFLLMKLFSFSSICFWIFHYLLMYFYFSSDPCAHGVRSLGSNVCPYIRHAFETLWRPSEDCQCCQCCEDLANDLASETLVDDPSWWP